MGEGRTSAPADLSFPLPREREEARVTHCGVRHTTSAPFVPSPGGRGCPSEARAGEGFVPLDAITPHPSRARYRFALATLSLWEREEPPRLLICRSLSLWEREEARVTHCGPDMPPARLSFPLPEGEGARAKRGRVRGSCASRRHNPSPGSRSLSLRARHPLPMGEGRTSARADLSFPHPGGRGKKRA